MTSVTLSRILSAAELTPFSVIHSQLLAVETRLPTPPVYAVQQLMQLSDKLCDLYISVYICILERNVARAQEI